MSFWYYAKKHKSIGPISEKELKEKIKLGEVKAGTLVWKRGIKTWQPVDIHFSKEISSQNQKSVEVKPPETPQKKDKPTFKNPIPQELFIPLIACGAGFSIFFIVNAYFETENFSLNGFVWVASLITASLAGAFLLFKTWKIAERKHALTKGQKGGGLKLTSIVLGIILAVFTITFLAQAPLFFRVDKVRKAYDDFTMDVDVASNTISINGTIGPSFASRLKESLDLYAGMETIEISSAGGLVDQALQAASVIEQYPELTVIARKSCNSACLVILMAAENRLADWNMKFGFHGTSSITNMPEEYLELSELGEEADKYLIKRGVSSEILNHGFGSKEKNLKLVPAIILADLNTLSGLVDGNKLLQVDVAKWRFVEEILKSSEDQMATQFYSVLETIRKKSPEIVKKYAGVLYKAYTDADIEQVKVVVKAIVGELIPQAIQAADNDDLYSYINSNLKQISYLVSTEQWDSCFNYINGNASGDLDVLSHASLSNEFEMLVQLIKSASRKNWTPQPIPSWVSGRSDKIIEDILIGMAQEGYDIQKLETDKKVLCVFSNRVIDTAMKDGKDNATFIIRWINKLEETSTDQEALFEGKRFSLNDVIQTPVVTSSEAGPLYELRSLDTSPLLYSPQLDKMVNPECPLEDMGGTIRNQIGFDCIGN